MGTGNNPEFIYALRNVSDLFPNPETFGIAYLPHDMMKMLFAESSTVNNLVFTLEQGADYQEVEEHLKAKLKPYGLISMYPRKDQVSHMLLTQELTSLKGMSQSMPVIFLAVACMILYIMLKRTIENQRGQIGILKAFGYTQKEILCHYLSFALTVGLCGGILGGISGSLLAAPLTTLYETFFSIPGVSTEFSFSYLLMSIFLTLIFTLFAGYQGCKGILQLEPAEAMRPPAPPIGENIFLEKISFFGKLLPYKAKCLYVVCSGIRGALCLCFWELCFTFALVSSPWILWDIVEKMMFDQYEKIESYDAKVNLTVPLNQQQLEQEFNRLPGVKKLKVGLKSP